MKWSGILTTWCTRWVSDSGGMPPRKVLALELFSRLKLMHSRGSLITLYINYS